MSKHLYIGKVFTTFKDFEAAQEQYQKENNVVWVTKSSSTIKKENQLRLARLQAPYPSNYEYKNIVFRCKFGGEPRPSKSAHIRPNQSTWKVKCEAKLQLIAYDHGLEVVQLHDVHTNHECTEEEMDVIPENRHVHPKDLKTLNTLLKGKVRPGRIKPILSDLNTKRMTPRDIANHRAKLQREERGGRTESDMLRDTLLDIAQADPGSTIETVKGDDGTLQMLFVQTSAMRENVKNYGVVVMMDHTYKIDKNGMPVTVLMVRDGNGLGRAAGLAYVADEEKVTVASVLQSFRDSIGEELANEVKTFVIDKDMSEAGAISRVFPNARIQLCDFHVSNTFTTNTTREDKAVKDILKDLRFCTEEKTFDNLCKKLKEKASKKFYDYFDKNWRKCALAWSFRQKKTSPNLGNNTNNVLENFNGKIKMVVNSDYTVEESLRMLLKLIDNREENARFANTISYVKHKYVTNNSDPVIVKVINDLTKFAADLVRFEHEVADECVLREETTERQCDCPHFFNYMGLPCRHIFKFRMEKGLVWYDPTSIHPRWKLYNPSNKPLGSDKSAATVISRTIPAKTIPNTANQRYSKAQTLCKKITNVLAACGKNQFGIRFKALDDVLQYWCKGEEVTVSISGQHVDCNSEPGEKKVDGTSKCTVDLDPEKIGTDSMAQEDHIFIEVPAHEDIPASTGSRCGPCSNGHEATGLHVCISCGKAVHLLKECSLPLPDQQEGCGEMRICVSCSSDDMIASQEAISSTIEVVSSDRQVLKETLGNIKLPPSVKHKGRPKGTGKTNDGRWQKGKGNEKGPKRTRGIIRSLEEREEEAVQRRKMRAQNIPDHDVVQNGNSWKVLSQTDKSTWYNISKKTTLSLSCICMSSEHCLQCLSCTCKDKPEEPCKHVYKIVNYYPDNIESLENTTEAEQLNAESLENTTEAEQLNTDKSTSPMQKLQKKAIICACGDKCLLRQTQDNRTYYGCWKHQCHFVLFLDESEVPAQTITATTAEKSPEVESPEIIELSSDSESEIFQPVTVKEETSSKVSKLVEYDSSDDELPEVPIIPSKRRQHNVTSRKRKAAAAILPDGVPITPRRRMSEEISDASNGSPNKESMPSEPRRGPKPKYYIPKCSCELVAVRKISYKQNGREYFVCPMGNCTYYRWADTLYNLAPRETDSITTDTAERCNADQLMEEGDNAALLLGMPHSPTTGPENDPFLDEILNEIRTQPENQRPRREIKYPFRIRNSYVIDQTP